MNRLCGLSGGLWLRSLWCESVANIVDIVYILVQIFNMYMPAQTISTLLPRINTAFQQRTSVKQWYSHVCWMKNCFFKNNTQKTKVRKTYILPKCFNQYGSVPQKKKKSIFVALSFWISRNYLKNSEKRSHKMFFSWTQYASVDLIPHPIFSQVCQLCQSFALNRSHIC